MKASDIRRGAVVEHDGRIWQVREVERSSAQARGGNVTFRFALYSIPGGQRLDLSLRADDDLVETQLNRRGASFSYKDDNMFVFMDDEDYSQYTLDAGIVGDAAGYVSEGLQGCQVQLLDGTPVALQLPPTVALEVTDTAPDMKGATATRRAKPATLATGIEVQVPEYVRVGDKVIINTLTGEFSGRA